MTDSSPVALRIPAILQNPTDHNARQVAAFNAQQREKAAARREAREVTSSYDGRGKRHVRRKDNAAFAANPHIVQPTRADFIPPVPLHHRKIQPTFPPSAVPRSEDAPSAKIPLKDPFSQDSHHGAFSTSLKGTRALLRKRGRRAEVFVNNVDNQLRGWLGGQGWDLDNNQDPSWTVIDEEMVEISLHAESSSPSTSRRIPEQHQLQDRIPNLPSDKGRVAAILELSRSPAHLTWAVSEGFERLIVHLLARYYDLVSWSEDHASSDNQYVRLTHIIVPSLAKPKIPQSLITPETTDISDLSAPSDTDISSDNDTESETETEMGDHEGDVTFTPELVQGVVNLHLERVPSNTSSMYASSEGGSEFGMADSMMLPVPSNGGWRVVSFSDAESDAGDVPRRSPIQAINRVKGWEDKPTFFEYLYAI